MGSPLPKKNSFLLFQNRHERPFWQLVVQQPNKATDYDTVTEKTHGGVVSSSSTCRPKQGAWPKIPWSMLYYLVSHYLSKLVLEVMGGAGAIWGFSEACGLRRPETDYIWRPAALVVGGMFFVRFLKELFTDMAARQESAVVHDSTFEKSDLEFTCTTATATTFDRAAPNTATTTPITAIKMSSPTNREELPVSPLETEPLTSNLNINLPLPVMISGVPE